MDSNTTPIDVAPSTTSVVEQQTSTNGLNTFFALFNIVIGLIGLAGNAIVCLTVYRSRVHHNITHYLIASLAMSDFLCCVFFILSILIPVEGKEALFQVDIAGGFFGEIFCRLFWSLHLFWSSFFASAFNLVVVTFERYFAIVHPMTYTRTFTERRGLMLAGAAWALGFLLEIEFPIRYYVDEDDDCVFPGFGPVWFAKLMFLKSFTVSFVVPLIFLVWAYYKIIKTLRKAAANPERQGGMAGQQGAEMYRASRRVVQSLLIITTLFIILLLPSELGNVMLFFEAPVDARSGIWEIFRTMTVLNSVVNPMIYAIKMKKFRRAMKATLCPCKKIQIRPEDTIDSTNIVVATASTT